MTPQQAAAIARISSFVNARSRLHHLDPEYVCSIHVAPNGNRSEHIRISDLRTLLAMASDTTPGDPTP
jgi:hypothetical protein